MSETPSTPDTSAAPEATPLEREGEPKVFDAAYVKSLRDEAAAARVAKKEAVDQAVAAANAQHQADLAARDLKYTELEKELGEAWVELEKLYTAIDAKVPSDRVRQFVSLLQGTDKDSIGASAKAAYELAGGFSSKSPAYDPSQGLGGRKDPLPLNGDPILNAIKGALKIQ